MTRVRPDTLLVAAGAFMAVVTGWVTVRPGAYSLVVATGVAAVAVAFAFHAPRALLFGLLAWLAVLGLVRRLLPAMALLGHADPLLAVAPVALGLLVLVSFRTPSPRRTQLTAAVAVLTALILVAALNPLQGSGLAGVAGLLFVLVPTLGFWIGRTFLDDTTFRRLIVILAAVALVVAAYGLVQTFGHFPSWDERWIIAARNRYGSLDVLGATRPFSTFSASAEYGFYLAIGAVVWLVAGTGARRPLLTAAALGLLGMAVVYQSSRGVVVAFAFAAAMVVSAWWRLRIVASVVVVAATFLFLVAGARLVAPGSAGAAQSASQLAAHQAQGLANPLDPEASTLGVHLRLIGDGLAGLKSEPLGIGLGPITIAGRQFGGIQQGTEADPSNVAVAMGVPGLLAYLTVLALGLGWAYRLARRRRDVLSLAALGILSVTLLQWLNGGQYAVAVVPWLVLGWIDRTIAQEASE